MTSSWRAVVEAAAAQATNEQVETARRALDNTRFTQIYLRTTFCWTGRCRMTSRRPR
jgi:hypothetical protein